MSALKKFFRNHQLETYLLIVLPTTWILISGFYKNSLFSILATSTQELAVWSFFYGDKILYFGLIGLYLYFYFRIIIGIGSWISKSVFGGSTSDTFEVKNFFLSFIYLALILGIGNLLLSLCLIQLCQVSSQTSIINASKLYMSLDKEIWGVIPQLWIQQFSKSHLFDYLLIFSYRKLCFFLTIVFWGLLLFNRKYFRKFIISFFIAPLISMPFWYLLPAVTPDEMYRQNIFSLESVLPTQHQFEDAIKSEKLKTYLSFLKKDSDKAQQHPIISTNPSMHVAWGGIIAYYAIILWWPLGFIFLPWLVLLIISTIYTMQHYVVDLPCGLICAAISIIITNYLFKIEEKYYTGKYAPLYFINIIQSDMQLLKTKLSAKFQKQIGL